MSLLCLKFAKKEMSALMSNDYCHEKVNVEKENAYESFLPGGA